MQSEKIKMLKKLRNKIHRHGGNDLVMAYMFYKHAESYFDTDVRARCDFFIYIEELLGRVKKKFDSKGNVRLDGIAIRPLKLTENYAVIPMIISVSNMFHFYFAEPGSVLTLLASIAREQLKAEGKIIIPEKPATTEEKEKTDEIHLSNENINENTDGVESGNRE